jgi:hypothetical protein
MSSVQEAPVKGSKTPAAKRYGLQLTLGGAASVPHHVSGVPGLWHPDHPTPVGEPGELLLQVAEALDADPGCPLKLVTIPAKDVPAELERVADELEEARGGLAAASRLIPADMPDDEKPHEAQVVEDQIDSVKGA